jgi:hypothetical protein
VLSTGMSGTGESTVLEEHRSGCLFVAGCMAHQEMLQDRFHAIVTTPPIPVVASETGKLAAAIR